MWFVSYVEDTRQAVHGWLVDQPPEVVAAVLDAGQEVLYGGHKLVRSGHHSGGEVEWRALLAQTWGASQDVLVVGYLASLVVPGDDGSVGWVEVEVGEPPRVDRQVEQNRELLAELPDPFTASIDCVTGQLGDGSLSWSRPIGADSANTLWAKRTVPMEIGYCQPETLIHHIRLCASFARWPYGSGSIYVYRMSQKRWHDGFGVARERYLPLIEDVRDALRR